MKRGLDKTTIVAAVITGVFAVAVALIGLLNHPTPATPDGKSGVVATDPATTAAAHNLSASQAAALNADARTIDDITRQIDETSNKSAGH